MFVVRWQQGIINQSCRPCIVHYTHPRLFRRKGRRLPGPMAVLGKYFSSVPLDSPLDSVPLDSGEARGEGSNSKDQHGDRSGRPALCDECAGYGDDYRLRLDGHSRSGPGYGQKLKTDGPASKGMGKSVCGLRPAFSAHVRLGEHRAPVQGSRVCLQLSFRGATHPLLSQTQGVDFSTQDPVGAGL